MKRPNILFITTDQQRRDTLGCYGNPLIKTPHIDRLAREGVLFERAYCQSPICIPSRITMITGKTAQHHGATLHNTSMRPDERTLGDVLKENEYRTHFIGKPHFSSQQNAGSPESIADWRAGLHAGWNGPYAGFETVEMILGHSNTLLGHYGDWLRENYPQHYKAFLFEEMESIDVTCGQGVYRNRIPEEACSSAYVGERTCDFLRACARQEKPFYCFASFPDPHWPINPPEPWFSMYDDVTDEELAPFITPYAGERENPASPDTFRMPSGRAPYDGGAHYMEDPADAYKIIRPYWGSVSLIDKYVGRMLDTLDECGLADDTIVIFTTDHGDYMGAHGMMAKGGFLWEEFIHIPFLARYPRGYAQGLRAQGLLSLTDCVPTLLETAGVPSDSLAYDGVSQREVLCAETESARDAVTVVHFANRDDPVLPDIHVLISGDYKLVYHAGTGKGELYCLRDDPKELHNLYEAPSADETRLHMVRELLDRMILEKDRQPFINRRGYDNYGVHVMMSATWEREIAQCMALRKDGK